ncbi:MAG: thioesterase II family protein [Myxococcaceae bacterium]
MVDFKKWLPLYKPRPAARLRLICFPFAGGGAQAYRGWDKTLPEDIEVCALSLPGRELQYSAPPFTDMSLVVDVVDDLLTSLIEDKPFAFFGYSLGAVIAFELARKLRREDRALPEHLFVAAAPAPHRRERVRKIAGLPLPEFVASLRKLDGTPSAVLDHETLMEALAPTLRADFQVVEGYTYQPEEPLRVPSTVLWGNADPSVREDEAEAWRELLIPSTRVDFAGGHFFIQKRLPDVLSLVARTLT